MKRIDKKSLIFIWDIGNIDKNKVKHKVEMTEAEEVFFDRNKRIFKDSIHSVGEERLRILGKTKSGRLLFIVYTKRETGIRIISARDINKKEVYLYEKTT